jgi:hypothetical protein
MKSEVRPIDAGKEVAGTAGAAFAIVCRREGEWLIEHRPPHM